MGLRIAQLRETLEMGMHCAVRHVDSTPVVELLNGEVAWDGVVETFELTGHPEAKYCYAWSCMKKDEDGPRCTIVLEGLHGVDSPEKAVKIYLAGKAKHKRTKWWPGMS